MSAFSVEFRGIEDAVTCDVAVASSDDATPKFMQCKSLWDTGAAFSVISRRLVDALGADPIDQGFAYTVRRFRRCHFWEGTFFTPPPR